MGFKMQCNKLILREFAFLADRARCSGRSRHAGGIVAFLGYEVKQVLLFSAYCDHVLGWIILLPCASVGLMPFRLLGSLRLFVMCRVVSGRGWQLV